MNITKNLRKRMRAVALVSVLPLLGVAGVAFAQYGTVYNQQTIWTTLSDTTQVYAGPSYNYPSVGIARSGQGVRLHGCLSGYTWCDVSFSPVYSTYGLRGYYPEVPTERGWVRGADLSVWRNNHAYPFSSAQRWYTYPVVTFILDQYWTNNYRQRSWYQQRERFRSYTTDNNRYRYERSNDRNRYRNRDRNRNRDDRYYNDRFQRDRWGRGDRDNNRTWQTRPTIEVKKPRVVTRPVVPPVVEARPRVVVPTTTRQTLETKKSARVRSYEEKRRVRGKTTTDQDQKDD